MPIAGLAREAMRTGRRAWSGGDGLHQRFDAEEDLRRQTYPTPFANWQGVFVGDGEIWFSGIGDTNTITITAIND